MKTKKNNGFTTLATGICEQKQKSVAAVAIGISLTKHTGVIALAIGICERNYGFTLLAIGIRKKHWLYSVGHRNK